MKPNPILTALCALVLSAVIIPSASAVPKYYEIGNASSVSAFTGPEPPFALVVSTSILPSVPGTNFTLDDGQMFSFDFFKIWTDETFVNADDTVPQSISATLNFVAPPTNPAVGGNTVGISTLYGIIQYGQVTWNGPALITIPGDREFSVTLSDEKFNKGFFGLNEGEAYGAIVKAKIEQITSSNFAEASVPETGSTAMIFGLALTGMMVAARKRVLS